MKILACLLALALTGCRSLPNLSSDEIHTRTSALGVAVTADATGIRTTDKYIVAEDVTWGISFPGFDHLTRAKKYRQKRPAASVPNADAP